VPTALIFCDEECSIPFERPLESNLLVVGEGNNASLIVTHLLSREFRILRDPARRHLCQCACSACEIRWKESFIVHASHCCQPTQGSKPVTVRASVKRDSVRRPASEVNARLSAWRNRAPGLCAASVAGRPQNGRDDAGSVSSGERSQNGRNRRPHSRKQRRAQPRHAGEKQSPSQSSGPRPPSIAR